MTNLFTYEIKSNLKKLIIWTIAIAAVNMMYLAIFPSMSTEAMQQIGTLKLDSLPPELLKALNMSSMIDFTDIISYLALVMTYTSIATGIFALILSGTIFSKEEDTKTIQFLLSQPITRIQIVTSKVVAGFTIFTIFSIVQAIVVMVGIAVFVQEPTTFDDVYLDGLKIMIGQYATGCILLSIGFLVSTFLRRNSISILFGIFFTMFFMGMISRLNDSLSWLINFAPTSYFDPNDLVNDGFQQQFIYIGLNIIFICLICTYIRYYKKDFEV